MPKYKSKPLDVDAFRIGHHPEPEWFAGLRRVGLVEGTTDNPKITVLGLVSPRTATAGDWIIRRPDGRLLMEEHEDFTRLYVNAD